MDEKLKPLFTPWRIGNCEIKKPYRIDFYGRNRSVRMDGEKPF